MFKIRIFLLVLIEAVIICSASGAQQKYDPRLVSRQLEFILPRRPVSLLKRGIMRKQRLMLYQFIPIHRKMPL